MVDAQTNTTKPIFSAKILGRRVARLAAVQCLYSIETGLGESQSIEDKIVDMVTLYAEESLGKGLPKVNKAHLVKLLKFIIKHRAHIENIVSKYLSVGWRIERLPKVVMCILLAAIAELLFDLALDKKIIINDYLEIAKALNHEGETGFINSVLDKAALERAHSQTFGEE